MRPRRPVATIALAALAGGVAACDRPLEVRTPPPAIVADLPDSVPPLPLSVLEAPIAYDLAPALAVLEQAVPRRFGDLRRRLPVAGNRRVHVAFAATRSPFRVALADTVVTISTIVQYEGRGWYRPVIGPEVSGGCDRATERPRLRVVLESRIGIDTAWRLTARTRLARVAPLTPDERDRCMVTFLRVDVTDRVVAAARRSIATQLRRVDREIAAIDVRDRVAGWWQAMARPIRLRDSLWLLIGPRAVALDRIEADSAAVIALVTLSAEPRIRSGPRPADPRPALPPLGREAPTGTALYATLEGLLDYATASGELTRRLGGRRVAVGGRRVRIERLTLVGIGGGRIALALDFTGDARGRIWLSGTPRYDAATRTVTVPDLDLDAGSATLLVRGIEWLKGIEVRDFLRAQARLPVDGLLEQARLLTERAMNRPLASGVDLVSNITRGDVVGVRATRTSVVIRARAQGTSGLIISRAPPVPRRRAPVATGTR